MKTIKILSMAVLALVGAALTGCSKDDSSINDNPEQPTNPKNIVTLTTTISRDADDPTSRALTPAGVKTFAVGETMAVVYNNGTSTVKATSRALTAGDITNEGKSATFTFELETPNKSVDVTYIYPAAMANDGGSVNYAALNSQDGLLSTLASNLDLATCTAAWNSGNLPNCTLENQLAILAITLKNEAGSSEITGDITGMTLSDGTNSYSVSRSAAEGPIYVAIRPTSSANIEITATDGSSNYVKSLTDKTYEANNGYNVSWRMANMLQTPLTFEAKTAGATVTFTKGSSVTLNDIEYNVYDGNGWQSYTYGTGITLTNIGNKVSFRGDNAAYATGTTTDKCCKITCSADCYIYGNIMSLVSSTDYADAKSLTGSYAFCRLFYSNSHIVNHPSKTLVLPATTLVNSCYYYMFTGCTGLETAPALPATSLSTSCYSHMFQGCTSLTTAPALPATTLVNYCYYYMFQGCTSLTTAPALPATTLANYCYYYMFTGCTSLTTAPALPATTLANYCYQGMFQGCTSLTTAPALPAETLAKNCYQGMFQGCTSLETAPALPATSLSTSCYREMFQGCTSLTTAPALPATTLADGCYNRMFYDCTNLRSVTCLATSGINVNYSTQYWLSGTATSGTRTFYKNKDASVSGGASGSGGTWPRSVDGIPSGWTVVNAQ